jgi:formylglycine-generating enzyme
MDHRQDARRSATSGRIARALVCAVSLPATMGAASGVPARAAPVWTRVELVENTADGPAFDRCQVEATLGKGETARWRLFYGEARADAASGWAAIRTSSGCAQAEAGHPETPWTSRGSPYFLVDVAVGPASVLGREVQIEGAFTLQRLTGFAEGGAPTYEATTEKRTLRVPEGGSAVVPILFARQKETDEFRVRELLLRFHAGAAASRPPVEYGEMAVAADVPRAEIFLDGGYVGRTSSDGPAVLGAVRVGEREVIVQDASGRDARAVAHVEKGRRSSVSLALRKGALAAADAPRPLGRNPQGGEEFWREKDGAILVRIPGGEFEMGSAEGEGDASERPRHAVRVQGFLMDKTEVTWGQYRRFLTASSPAPPQSPIWGMPDALPVSSMTWDEAHAFCAWAGGRLPTEAEWERAARGGDSRQFPWGNAFDPWRCNTRDGGPHAPTPAAEYADCVGPYGVLDLTGSVSEWCSDWYDEGYYAKSPADNPTGPETGTRRASRGGGWMSPSPSSRAASRAGVEPAWHGPMQGFRCVEADSGADRAAATVPRDDLPISRRVEVRVETVANIEGGPVESCEVVQTKGASSSLSFSSWSTVGEARPSQIEPSRKAGIDSLRATARHCGAGASPSPSPEPSGGAPPLIQEVTAGVGWDPGAMDPGPVGAFRVALTIASRQQTGFSPDGKPLYGAPVTDHRSVRLEPGEEYVVPLLPDARARETLGVREVLVRIGAGWAGRERATEYGSIAVTQAAPGSEIVLDGGVAGHAGADGSLLLQNVPVGRRGVRIRGVSGAAVSRFVSVAKGRKVLVVPAPAGGGSPPQPSLTPTGKNAEGFQEYRRARDGAVMIEIPEGEFLMGNLETEGAPLPHTVSVSSFLMDKLPLTVGLYERFAAATGRPLPPDPYWGVHDDFPVAFVRWDEAKAYCEWTSARLPTEAEREKATRGTDGRKWPWGSEPPSPERGVFRRNWGQEGNDAVGIRPAGASPYGLLDTGGNMWEFCEDWWDPDYFKASPQKDPLGPKTGRARVVKGGSWDSRPTVLSASSRNFAYVGYREGDFGFRCAADLPR